MKLSEWIAENAVKTIGEERIRKYLFRCEGEDE